MPAMARAEFYTGNNLFEMLEADRAVGENRSTEYFKAGVGSGYVVGVWDAYVGTVFCEPGGVTAGQVKAVALKFLKENPERLHLSAESLLRMAFVRSFPCKK